MPIIRPTVVFDTPYFLARSRWRGGSAQSMSFATSFTSFFVRTSGVPGFFLCFLLEDFFRALFLWHWWCYRLSSCKLKFLLLQDFCLPFWTILKSGAFPKHTLLGTRSFSRSFLKIKAKTFFCNLSKWLVFQMKKTWLVQCVQNFLGISRNIFLQLTQRSYGAHTVILPVCSAATKWSPQKQAYNRETP